MNKFLLSVALLALAASAFSQSAFQTEAILTNANGETLQAWILAATSKGIRYKRTAASTDFTDAKSGDFTTIFLKQPPAYSQAMDLFESRKYNDAKSKFAEIKEEYKPVETLKDNHHTLASFYEMECMRKLGDYAGLAKALESFDKKPLTRDHQLRQLDLYTMWDAVRTEGWERVLAIVTEREGELLPGYQRAQVAFCKGLALEKTDREPEAILAYNVAITADAGASESVAQEAALNALRVYLADEEVKTAIAEWETAGENKNSGGYSRLKEAAALADFYEKFLKVGKPLPADVKDFLKFGA